MKKAAFNRRMARGSLLRDSVIGLVCSSTFDDFTLFFDLFLFYATREINVGFWGNCPKYWFRDYILPMALCSLP